MSRSVLEAIKSQERQGSRLRRATASASPSAGQHSAIRRGSELSSNHAHSELLASALEAAHLADPHPATADMSAHMLLAATAG
jgi:hypothetical protein